MDVWMDIYGYIYVYSLYLCMDMDGSTNGYICVDMDEVMDAWVNGYTYIYMDMDGWMHA
jgi:hypothetical protein